MKMRLTFLAVALMALVSCSKYDIGEVEAGSGNVNFTIQTPGVGTKSIGDGENINVVYYEIYKAEANHKNSVNGGVPLIDGLTTMSGKEASLSLRLLDDQTYVGLFWAQVGDANVNKFYDVTDLRNVTANYTDAEGKAILGNNESRAAFCEAVKFTTDNGKITVELVRPFAQLNLGTTKESVDLDYHIELEESKMLISGVAKSYNVAQMAAGSEQLEVLFDFGAVPQQMLQVKDVFYAYAGMNYFFVPADEANINLVYDIKTDVGTVNRSVSSVPVKTNHRTNILGNLLTKETVIEIVVEKGFVEDDSFEGNEIIN